MRTIFSKKLQKPYQEVVTEQTVSFPIGSELLGVQMDSGHLFIWLLGPTNTLYTNFNFTIIDTTDNRNPEVEIPDNYQHLGTVIDGIRTYHVFHAS